MESFRKLGLAEEIIKAIDVLSFTEPTEIQEKAIPLALKGKDIIGSAATGSGKTLAFGASIIQNLPRGQGIQSLVLTPTRELAEQVGKTLLTFSKFKKLNVAIVYGGVSLGPQANALRNAEAVVGTPGRILDHLERGTLNLKKVKVLVLDEADRMLDMGFIEDVNKIISKCPKERQTFLFSATITPDISHLAKKYLNNPIEISAESYVDPSKLEQGFYDTPQNQKFSLLVHLLQHEHPGFIMVFCNTRHNTDFVAHNLQKEDIDALAIHGGLTQARRNHIMENFRKGKVVVLVCTDVAARGLDIKNVSHVYNYDLPTSSKDYIHRIGRTARAGKEGKAVSIVSARDYENFRNILKDDSLKIAQEKMPDSLKPLRVSLQYGDSGRRSFKDRQSGSFRGHDNRENFHRRENRSGGERRRSYDGGRRFSEGKKQFGGSREGNIGDRRSFGRSGHSGFGRSGPSSHDRMEGGERKSIGGRSFGDRERRGFGRDSRGGGRFGRSSSYRGNRKRY